MPCYIKKMRLNVSQGENISVTFIKGFSCVAWNPHFDYFKLFIALEVQISLARKGSFKVK